MKSELEDTLPQMTGKITRINKGFGFIEGEDGRDYFMHWKDFNRFEKQFRAVKVGDNCSFKAGKSELGPKAFDITVRA